MRHDVTSPTTLLDEGMAGEMARKPAANRQLVVGGSQIEERKVMAYTREADQGASIPRQERRDAKPQSDAWLGWVGFAGIMMVMVGIFQVIEGMAALFRDQYFLVTKSGLLVTANYTAWGWTHTILGIVVIAAGFGVFSGRIVARLIGILLALASATVNLAFLSAYPVWSTILITLDVIVIYALAVHGGAARKT
jgi:hypothetical protein